MASYADPFLATPLSQTERSAGVDVLRPLEGREKARAAIKAAKQALAAGKTIDLVEVNRAYQALYGVDFPSAHR